MQNDGDKSEGEMREVIEKLSEKWCVLLMEPATEEQISQFEHVHGITLPDECREWLRCSDGGELVRKYRVQICGVAHEPLILPLDGGIVMGEISTGYRIILKNGGEGVEVYDLEKGKTARTFEDFGGFLNDLA